MKRQSGSLAAPVLISGRIRTFLALEMAAMKPEPIPEQNIFLEEENQTRIGSEPGFPSVRFFIPGKKRLLGENLDRIKTKEGSGSNMEVQIRQNKPVLFRCELEPWFCSGIRFGSGNHEGETSQCSGLELCLSGQTAMIQIGRAHV